MQHLVRFKTAQGKDGTHFADSMDEAVAFLERVRNSEDATEVHLFRLTEVPIQFRTYYQVQVGAAESTPASSSPVSPAASSSQTTTTQKSPTMQSSPDEQAVENASAEIGSMDQRTTVPSDLSAVGAAANGRRLFSRT